MLCILFGTRWYLFYFLFIINDLGRNQVFLMNLLGCIAHLPPDLFCRFDNYWHMHFFGLKEIEKQEKKRKQQKRRNCHMPTRSISAAKSGGKLKRQSRRRRPDFLWEATQSVALFPSCRTNLKEQFSRREGKWWISSMTSPLAWQGI